MEAPTQLTTYSELKRQLKCNEHSNRACWVILPQYSDHAGEHLTLGEAGLQMWADVIVCLFVQLSLPKSYIIIVHWFIWCDL